jgi:hypothetical protein
MSLLRLARPLRAVLAAMLRFARPPPPLLPPLLLLLLLLLHGG